MSYNFQERTTLLKRLSTLKDLEISQTVSEHNDLDEPVSITGMETFSLSYKVSFACASSHQAHTCTIFPVVNLLVKLV